MGRKIGIVGFMRNDMFGVHEDYLHFVEQFGTPVIIPRVSRNDFFHKFKIEGLVLPGGADVSPWRYAKNALHAKILARWFCYPSDPYQEHFDTQILPGVIHAGFPVFGICRGLQTLNVHFGGTLKNIHNHPTSKNPKNRLDLVHEVYATDVQNSAPDRVNSFHHQAIGRLAEGFRVMGESADNVIERFHHETLPVAGVQYHPERMDDAWANHVCGILFR